ncbi:MAG: hypothetical protein ACREGJ_04320 [Candidatus Saccharimonadales bacterium]
MAAKSPKLLGPGKWHLSWKRLLIAASIVLNIGFLVVFVSMATTNAFDGLYVREGLERYCDTENDNKFEYPNDQAKAQRDFLCARGEAQEYFTEGFKKYLDFKSIPYSE